jgi:hypothetical protein
MLLQRGDDKTGCQIHLTAKSFCALQLSIPSIQSTEKILKKNAYAPETKKFSMLLLENLKPELSA